MTRDIPNLGIQRRSEAAPALKSVLYVKDVNYSVDYQGL